MPDLVVTDRSGVETVVNAAAGLSVMEVLREAGLDELMAICGGCCSCATCHVYVDPDFFGYLKAASEDENDLLDTCSNRSPFSRLACQIVSHHDLDGLKVTIPPEE